MTNYYPDSAPYIRTSAVLYLKYKILLLGSLIGVSLLISCTEDPTKIGINLLPGSDFVNVRSTDTIHIDSYTEYSDSVKTNNRTYSYLGSLYDPYFGTTTTDFVGQLRLLKEWDGGDPFEIDSVKLFFKIAGAKGAVELRQKLDIYEVDEYLTSDSSYYSNRDAHSGKYLGKFNVPAVGRDTSMYITVNLSKEFGQYLTRDTNMLFQDDPKTDFRSFFKGIHLQMRPLIESKSASPGKGSEELAVFAMTFSSGYFTIRLYYSTPDTNLVYDFVINKNSVRYNRYFQDLSTAQPEKKIQHISDGVKDTLSYMQGFNGVYTRIKIPGLERYRDSLPISVNKAHLTIPVFLDDDLYTATSIASKIYMTYKAADSTRTIVPDYLLNAGYFGGSFSSSTKKFTFNLAAFVQEYLEGSIPSPELNLYFPEGEYKNTILKANHSTAPALFEFVYTRF